MMAVGYTFEIDSTVGRYWLAHGAGFDVVADRGRKVGVVEDVVLDPATQNVSLVLVRRHGRRTAKVPPAALSAVLPASRCFVVDPARFGARKRRRAVRPTLPNMRPAAERAQRLLARVAAAVAAGAAAVARWIRAKWPVARDAVAAAVARGAAGASRAWREAQQRYERRS
jgi:hypothetical protein